MRIPIHSPRLQAGRLHLPVPQVGAVVPNRT